MQEADVSRAASLVLNSCFQLHLSRKSSGMLAELRPPPRGADGGLAAAPLLDDGPNMKTDAEPSSKNTLESSPLVENRKKKKKLMKLKDVQSV